MSYLRGFFFLRKNPNEIPASDWITFDEIERLLRKRRIDTSWLVRRGGDHEWVTIAELMQEAVRGNKSAADPPDVSFACIKCRVALRIQLRFEATIYRCPNCGTSYRSVQASASSPVFLVIPADNSAAATGAGPVKRSRSELPSEVRGALTVLELEETSSFDAVRQAHRELIKSYHPDKVAHLGPDLQKLAEVKTKMINASYKVLEDFFAANGR